MCTYWKTPRRRRALRLEQSRSSCRCAQEWQADLQLAEAENKELLASHREVVLEKQDLQKANRPPVVEHDPLNNACSPYRGGNHDLLKTLCVDVATGEVARELQASAGTAKAGRFLHAFHAAHPLAGEAVPAYHRADVFLTSLLEEPFVISDGTLIDTLDIASLVMRRRQQLASEWIASLADFPALLVEIKRAHVQKSSLESPHEK